MAAFSFKMEELVLSSINMLVFRLYSGSMYLFLFQANSVAMVSESAKMYQFFRYFFNTLLMLISDFTELTVLPIAVII